MSKIFLGVIPIGVDGARGEHDPAVMAGARATLRQEERRHSRYHRLQPLVDRIEAHLREELRDALRAGDNGRRRRAEAEIDAFFRLANEAVHEGGRHA